MSENTKIEWADHTFNPWIGCTKVSPGCENCYAETYDRRWGGGHWGKGAPRKRTSDANWRKPLKWNRDAEICKCGRRKASALHDCEFGRYDVNYRTKMNRPRVFCASLADWLDHEVPVEWLADLLGLIHATPNLDWLLLTKRPENWFIRMGKAYASAFLQVGFHAAFAEWMEDWRDRKPPSNVWIGTTVEDQQRADERIPHLLQIPARVRFLSCEPLLGPLDLQQWQEHLPPPVHLGWLEGGIHWVICGGESGPEARPMHPDWARILRDQCQEAGVPFFFKQWGEYLPILFDPAGYTPDPNGLDWHSGKKSVVIQLDGSLRAEFPRGAMTCIKLGKSAAGRLLDGREHSEFPKP